MSRYFKEKEIVSIYYGRKVVKAVYRGLRLVWRHITSCFSSGYWVGSEPWSGADSWKG